MNGHSRVNHEEYQTMLATILKLRPVELRILARSMENFATVTEQVEEQVECS